MFLGTELSEMKSTNSFFILILFFLFLFFPPLSCLFGLSTKRFPKRGTSVKRTRFLSKNDFQDNPEGIKDFPREKNDFLIWPRDNGKIHDERNDFLKWPGSDDKFHENKMIEGTNNHDEPSPIK